MVLMPYTTPTHIFLLPLDTATLAEAKICYAQEDNIIVAKQLMDCTVCGKELSVTLTQEETALFDPDKIVQIQLHLLTNSGLAIQSEEIKIDCERVLDREVIRNAD